MSRLDPHGRFGTFGNRPLPSSLPIFRLRGPSSDVSSIYDRSTIASTRPRPEAVNPVQLCDPTAKLTAAPRIAATSDRATPMTTTWQAARRRLRKDMASRCASTSVMMCRLAPSQLPIITLGSYPTSRYPTASPRRLRVALLGPSYLMPRLHRINRIQL